MTTVHSVKHLSAHLQIPLRYDPQLISFLLVLSMTLTAPSMFVSLNHWKFKFWKSTLRKKRGSREILSDRFKDNHDVRKSRETRFSKPGTTGMDGVSRPTKLGKSRGAENPGLNSAPLGRKFPSLSRPRISRSGLGQVVFQWESFPEYSELLQEIHKFSR